MRYLLLAMLLLSGCEPHDHPRFPCSPDSLTNTGPHAVVLSNGERCLLLRPGESGVWSGDAEISTPDGYEKEDIK